MKKIIFLSLIISLIIVSWSYKKPVEKTVLGMWTDYYVQPVTMKGKVKEFKELNYLATEKDGKITKGKLMVNIELNLIGSTPNLVAYFDDKGNVTRYDRLDGEAVAESNIGTIKNGKYVRWDHKVKDSITYYRIPEYDKSGFLIGVKNYKPVVDTLQSKIVAAHDSKGNYTKYEYFDYKNQKTGYHVCSLDEKGNYIEAKYFNKNDSLTSTLKTIFDKAGNMIKQETINEKPKSTGTWDYKDLKLDDHGNTTEYYSNIDNGPLKIKLFIERSFIYY